MLRSLPRPAVRIIIIKAPAMRSSEYVRLSTIV
jgi:hypothetical protein